MTDSIHRPRWAEGSVARIVHALAVCLALEVLVLISRHVLVPALGRALAGVTVFVLCYGGILGVLMIRVGRLRARDLGVTRHGWPREVLLGVAAFVAISALMLGWIALSDGTAAAAATWEQLASYTPAQHAAFLVTGLLASSVEEPLFRGYIQPSLMARLGPAAGLVLTMVLFQIGHYTDWPTIGRVGSLAILGLGFGVLRWQSRPLTASFTAHTLVWVVWGNA